ncbi:MAG: diguanylate cyclase with and sensor [Betaproteobacteria bacterium]|nr:diguanylate cyclase with and sensor [Betaproteobacteria bacterium]
MRLNAGSLRRRLARRADSEHVQAVIRIGFGLFISAYLYATAGWRVDIRVVCMTFEILAAAIFLAIILRPQPSASRQVFGALVDLGTTTYLMWTNGEIGAPLYGIYLWVTFGNGFRYGVRSLYASHAMSMVGFGLVAVVNPFWREHPLMAGGFLVTLAAVPAYGAVLLKAVERANRTLREQAMRDVLTGLYNRRYLLEAFERELRRARRSNERLGVMIIDIDHFKRFNDTYGHAAGDEVLRSVAQLMLTLVRGEDILCRFGGEEFVLVQMKASAEAIMQRADRLRQEIGDHEIVHEGRRLGPVTLSIGISMFPDHGTTTQMVLRGADAAMYRAKNAGRNRVVMAPGAEALQHGAGEAVEAPGADEKERR